MVVAKQVAAAAAARRVVAAAATGKLKYRKDDDSDFNSFTYNSQSGFKIEGDGKLYLSKIVGSIRIVLHSTA